MDKTKRIYSVDFLKTIAMLMVILVHTTQRIDGLKIVHFASIGARGVDLFFLLAGFSSCISWEKETLLPFKNRYFEFVKKRIKSIVPIYFCFVLLWLGINILGKIVHVNIPFASTTEPFGLLVNALCLHGFFPKYINNAVPGGWYIGTSMIFYAVFPFLYMLFASARKKRTTEILLYVAICIISIVHSFFVKSFFVAINNLPAFALGILLHNFKSHDVKNSGLLRAITVFFSFATVILFYIDRVNTINLNMVLFPFSFGMVFYLLIKKEQATGFGARICKISKLGAYTYEAYLIHPFFAWLLPSFLLNVFKLYVNSELFWVAIFAVSVVGSFYLAVLFGKIRKIIGI